MKMARALAALSLLSALLMLLLAIAGSVTGSSVLLMSAASFAVFTALVLAAAAVLARCDDPVPHEWLDEVPDAADDYTEDDSMGRTML